MTTQNKEFLKHPFNNCGVAPFEYVGYTEKLYYPCKNIDGTPDTSVPPVAGGCCDHCGTGIRHAYIVRDAKGKVFEVGSSCIAKADLPAKIVSKAQEDKRKRDAQRRKEIEAEKIAELKDDYKAALEVLAMRPHPNEYFANQGKTLKDYYLFCGQNSKTMKKAIKDAE